MLTLLALVGALAGLDALAWFFGVDSRPTIGDAHCQQAWRATVGQDLT